MTFSQVSDRMLDRISLSQSKATELHWRQLAPALEVQPVQANGDKGLINVQSVLRNDPLQRHELL